MIPLLLANWKWGVIAGLVALLGFARLEIADLKADAAKTALAIEAQKTEAANLLAAETAKVLERERANAALNAQLEKDRADAAAKDAAAAANLADTQRVWQRAHPGCRAGSADANGANSGPGRPVDAAPERVEILPVGSHGFIQRCSADHDALAGYARECRAFVGTLK